jgi:hypothetical protein
MALKGLVHKVFGAPPGAVPRGPKPGVPEAAAGGIETLVTAFPVNDSAPSNEDLGPLQRVQPPVVDIDNEKLEEIVAAVKSKVEVEADVVVDDDQSPEPVTDEITLAESDDNPVELAAEAVADVIADDTGTVVPDDSLETAEADEAVAAESGDAPDEGEDGEDKEEGGGDLFNSLFAGITEEEEDDYLSRLIATIPEITAQDLLDQAEDLKALMHDLE